MSEAFTHKPVLSENTFTHDGKRYDLTKVRLMMQKAPTFILPIRELLWVLKHDTPQEHRVEQAKLRYPLLVVKWRGKWTVVDGLHRLERYRRRGFRIIPCKTVPDSVLMKARILQ